MGQWKRVLVKLVMHAQDPPAASCFDAVDGIAGNHLKCLENQCLGKGTHDAANAWARVNDIVHTLNVYPGRSTRNLDDISAKGFSGGKFAYESEGSLTTEHRNFDATSVFKHINKGHAGILRKICMRNHLAGLVKYPALRQFDSLQVRLKVSIVLGLQSSEKAVGSMTRRLSAFQD